MQAMLALEDGTVFEGKSFGAEGERAGEVVFNTSMMGYQEVLTDPSYKGQIVTMTYPLIGNYGVNEADFESNKPHLEGFIVKESSKIFSNWRAQKSLEDFLREYNIVGVEGIDTRALTKRIRVAGAMKGVISTVDRAPQSLVEKAKASPGLVGRDLVKEVTCNKSYRWSKNGRYQVVVVDCGVKYNILRQLSEVGCQVVVVPAKTKAEEILEMKPNGVLLSNGPGNPAAVPYSVEMVKKILERLPVFSVQFHPEASPGPHDANHLFKEFVGMVKKTSLS